MFSGKIDDRGLWVGIQVGVLFFFVVLVCIYLLCQFVIIVVIWLFNVIFIVVLLCVLLCQWLVILFCFVVVNLVVNCLYGDSLWMSVVFLLVNLSEVIFVVMLLCINWVCEDFEFNLYLVVCVFWVGVLILFLFGVLVGVVLVSVFGMGCFLEMWVCWYVGDVMGMFVLLLLCMVSNLVVWCYVLLGWVGVDNVMFLLVILVISFVVLMCLFYVFIYVFLLLLVVVVSISVFGIVLIGCLNICFIVVLIVFGVFVFELFQQCFGELLLYLLMVLIFIFVFLVLVIMECSCCEQYQVVIGEVQFCGVMEFLVIGMVLVLLEGWLFKVNEVLCWMFGYFVECLGELLFQEIIYVDDLELDFDLVCDLFVGCINFYQMEKCYLCQDGEIFWVCISVLLVCDEEGVVQYFVIQVEDIDSCKCVELECECFVEWIKLVIDVGQIGIWEWDLVCNCLYWDFCMFDLYGICSGFGEIMVEQWKVSLYVEDYDCVLCELECVFSGLQKFDCEFCIVCFNCEVCYLWVIVMLMCDEGNCLVWMIGINSDIIEICILVEILYEEKECLQVILYFIGDVVLIIDVGGCVIFMNLVVEVMIGWILQDVIGVFYELVFNVFDSDIGEVLESLV